MPRATVAVEPEEFALKSCEGAWVKLRRMSYGERLHRQDIAMTMSMQQDNRNKSSGKMEIKQAQTSVGAFEFSACIVEHNLMKDDGSLLNFRNGMDFGLLDGRIGEEISSLIEEMHNWEVEVPNSSEKYTPSSSVPVTGKLLDRHQTVPTGSWLSNS